LFLLADLELFQIVPFLYCRIMLSAMRFTAILLLLLPVPAFAWAPEGHQIVAAIAVRELTPNARARVSSLLGGKAEALMILEASWADEVRQQRPETGAWHYVNIETGSRGYAAARDCPGGNCVVAQIERDAGILSDPRAATPAKKEALLFLIHFVADIHQPLHAADHNDKGGNGTLVRLRGKRLSLHQVWDQNVVTVMGDDSERIAADIDGQLTLQQKTQIAKGTPADWANESFALASREIYGPLPPSGRITLPPDYPARELAVTRLQLARAGLRLAAILNRVFA
jgi:hypothetical protein